MKKLSLIHLFPLCISMALPGVGHAERNIDLTDLTQGDPFFYTSDQDVKETDGQKALVGTGRPNRTHSQIPHLPFYFGYMNTNYTYRFVTVAEQVLTMIGEGKHGLWRVQENGTVREYLRQGAKGLSPGADLEDPANLEIIRQSYSSYIPEAGWAGYKYPDEQLSKAGELNYIDLPIGHAKYGNKYVAHQPIDLPNFYCTMSENDYPYAQQVMNFAFQQPGANKIGPLGKRAGLDIKENYTQVIRINHLPDARSWVNVGEPGKDALHVKWEAVDTSKTEVEYYLVERPFFNKPYIFVAAVYDNQDNRDFQYVRPAGSYFDSIRDKQAELKTTVTPQPRFHLRNGDLAPAVGLPIYGVHHPNRAAYGGGGACPFKGGDWGRYPKTTGGSGWPTQYEEVTPLCDAVLVDIKFYANLDGRDWNDTTKYLGNAGVGSKQVEYKMQGGEYGVFTDPYNVDRHVKNAESQVVPDRLTLTYPSVAPTVAYTPVERIPMGPGMVPTKGSTCRPVPE